MTRSWAVYRALADWTTVGGILARCPGLTIADVRRALGFHGRRGRLEVLGVRWRRRR